jgi:RNA polymerase sigma factor (sigma-70 family)
MAQRADLVARRLQPVAPASRRTTVPPVARVPGPVGSRVVGDGTLADDRELMARVAGGDQDAFLGLVRRYGELARALATRVCRRPALAEEAVQEAFLSLWANARDFDPERGSVRAWVLGTVHHRAVDAVRREESQRRRGEQAARQANPPPVQWDPLDRVEAAAEREAVRRALRSLPEEQRRVIDLMYFEGLSQSRVAERLAVPLGTVKSRTVAAMRRLRRELLEEKG